MMDKTKHAICTVLLAMRDNHVPLPERAAVLLLRKDKQNFKTVLEALLPKDISADDARAVTESIREWSATLKPYTDDTFRKKFTDIHELVALAAGAAFVSKIKAEDVPTPVPAKPAMIKAVQLLPTLNGLLRLLKRPTLKSWKGSREALEKRIDDTRRQLEALPPPAPKKAQTVVAEGAYKTEEEAFARTGHRTNGKTKKMIKDEKRKERFIKARIEPTSSHTLKASELKGVKATKPKGDVVTLADVARTLNMQPKVARGKGRRYAKELLKLQIDKDSKYKYPPSNAEAVAAILREDGRKK